MNPMKSLIARLFRDSKEINNPIVVELRKEQPANNTFLECQLVLKSGYAAAGILTTTSEDMLRLASIAQTADKKMILADQYFAYEDLEAIVLGRPLELASVTPIRNGSPIILGH
jgi:hypothetical protein